MALAPRRHSLASVFFFAAILLPLPVARLLAQSRSPNVASLDPTSGKVGAAVTITGTNLAKSSVPAVFISDDKSDFRAVVVEQSADKIVIKIPQVKHGDYNLSFQEGAAIYILPFRFTVEE
jgi:IPT/TIG domain